MGKCCIVFGIGRFGRLPAAIGSYSKVQYTLLVRSLNGLSDLEDVVWREVC